MAMTWGYICVVAQQARDLCDVKDTTRRGMPKEERSGRL